MAQIREEERDWREREDVVEDRWERVVAEEDVRRWLFGEEGVSVTARMLLENGAIFAQNRAEVGPVTNPAAFEMVVVRQSAAAVPPVVVPVAQRGMRVYAVRMFLEEGRLERVVVDLTEAPIVTLAVIRTPEGQRLLHVTCNRGLRLEFRAMLLVDQDRELVPLGSTIMFPDCMFCVMRNEACTCSKLLWENASMEERARTRVDATSAWSFFHQHGQRMLGRATMYDTASRSFQRVTGSGFVVKKSSAAIAFVLQALCKDNALYSNVTYDADWPEDRPELFRCDFCGSMFEVLRLLKEHIADEHGREVYESSNTGESINTGKSSSNDNAVGGFSALSISPASTRPSRTYKRGTCEQCGMSFSRMHSLKRHISTVHMGEKKWRCEECSSVFSQRSHLLTHVRGMHEDGDETRCEICGRSFRWKPNYLRHMARCHRSAQT